MERAAWILVTCGMLAVGGSPALAAERAPVHFATRDAREGIPVHEVHHAHHGGYYGRYAPVVVMPAPPTVYAYPPAVVQYAPAPAVVYPPAYVVPQGYYAYPRSYIEYRGRGLSIGVGL